MSGRQWGWRILCAFIHGANAFSPMRKNATNPYRVNMSHRDVPYAQVPTQPVGNAQRAKLPWTAVHANLLRQILSLWGLVWPTTCSTLLTVLRPLSDTSFPNVWCFCRAHWPNYPLCYQLWPTLHSHPACLASGWDSKASLAPSLPPCWLKVDKL